MSPMSAEARAAASERMKKMAADKRAKKAAGREVSPSIEVTSDAALQEAMAKTTSVTVPRGTVDASTTPATLSDPMKWEADICSININVDWDHIPMPDAQQFYAHLKAEFEKAGRILNARSNERTSGYTCFMCKNHFNGNPGFTDYSYRDPITGLTPRVDCCGELCVINYHKLRIDMRTRSNIQQATEERGGA